MSNKPREVELSYSDEPLRQKLLRRLTTAGMIAVLIAYPTMLLRLFEFGFKPVNAIQSLLFCFVLGIFFARKRLGLRVSAAGLLLGIMAFILTGIGNYGILAPANLVVPFITIFSSLVFGRRVALWLFWLSIAALVLIGGLYVSGAMRYQVDVRVYAHSWTSWTSLVVIQAVLALWYLFLAAPINEAQYRLSQRLDAVLQGINDALFIHDKDSGAILQVNQRMCDMYGYSSQEALRLNAGELSAGSPPYDLEHARVWIAKAVSEGPQLFEWQAKDRAGRVFWVEVNMRSANLDGTQRILVVVRDISARKQAEHDIRQVQANLAVLLENTDELIWSVDLDSRYLFFNRNAQQHIRRTHGTEIRIGARLDEVMSADRAAFWRSLFARAVAQGPFCQELVLSDGTVHELVLNPIVDGSKKVGVSVFDKDITERKRAEAALKESERKFFAVFQISPYPIAITRVNDGKLIDVNDAFLAIEGFTRDQVLGKTTLELGLWADPQEHERVVAATLTGLPVLAREIRTRKRDGTIITNLFSAQIFQLGTERYRLSQVIDITERKRAEEEQRSLQDQLHQAQKMESIGRLAGGVAHDFNNLLGVILGETELALGELTEGDPRQEALERIKSAAERSAALTRQLLAFARQQPIAPQVLDLNKTVERMLKILRRLVGENIALSWQPGHELEPVKLDPSQIDQLLANLCVNARDAIAGVGKVIIESANASFDDTYCAEHRDCAPGGYVMLAVSDNGCGMTKEVQERIFEPFFTTKEQGKGTGLGLATVFGIVKQNEGFITVHSEPGQGTTFRIYLRQHHGPDAMVESPGATALPHGHGETVLMVEDDPSMLAVARTMLERLGFKVLPAATPNLALAKAAVHSGKIDLLVTDVIMPEMNGRDLYLRLAARRPGLKCLYVSGYTADVIARHGVLNQGVNFLPKPISLQSLSAKLRDVLADVQRPES
jgi:two-component system, cell cycle sensor histidine kinase and response regulator CckA